METRRAGTENILLTVALGAVRFSVGWETTKEENEHVIHLCRENLLH